VKILSTTICYPTPGCPNQGIFVRRRLEAMARLADVRVVCPVPHVVGRSQEPPADQPSATPPVAYSKMYYVPGVLKTFDATFFSMALARRLRMLRADFPFDLIDAHFVWPDGVGAAIVAWKLGVPVVVTVRGKIISQSRYVLRRRRIVAMLHSVDGCVAVSNALAERVRDLAGADVDVRVIPNGVDTAIFKPAEAGAARQALGLLPEPRYIVSVGQIREIKGFDRLVDVLPDVRRRAGDVRLLLIGPGIGETSYERRVRELIRQHQLQEVVALVGSRDASDVAAYLAAADVFALATRSEGWCNAIHEALAVGTPVVTTDVGGNGELVSSDQLGHLVRFGQPKALVDALVSALTTTWDRRAISSAGSRRSWEQAASETLGYFDQILSRRSGAGRTTT
jgi:glycosyltransferase involved in cell wall biosynthesis